MKRLSDRQWSQRELARQTGLNHSTLSRKLNGSYTFTLEEIFRICLALEMTATELLAEEAA